MVENHSKLMAAMADRILRRNRDESEVLSVEVQPISRRYTLLNAISPVSLRRWTGGSQQIMSIVFNFPKNTMTINSTNKIFEDGGAKDHLIRLKMQQENDSLLEKVTKKSNRTSGHIRTRPYDDRRRSDSGGSNVSKVYKEDRVSAFNSA
jgi:hypothetical protein